MEKNYIISKMGLRDGLSIDFVNERFSIDFLKKYEKTLEKYYEDGIIERKGNRIRFTDYGIYQSNKFFVDIV